MLLVGVRRLAGLCGVWLTQVLCDAVRVDDDFFDAVSQHKIQVARAMALKICGNAQVRLCVPVCSRTKLPRLRCTRKMLTPRTPVLCWGMCVQTLQALGLPQPEGGYKSPGERGVGLCISNRLRTRVKGSSLQGSALSECIYTLAYTHERMQTHQLGGLLCYTCAYMHTHLLVHLAGSYTHRPTGLSTHL